MTHHLNVKIKFLAFRNFWQSLTLEVLVSAADSTTSPACFGEHYNILTYLLTYMTK